MIKDLDLSAAQGEKIKALNIAFAEKQVAARKAAREAGGDRAAMREKMQGLRAAHQTDLKKYLTAEQVAKWEKIQAERPNRDGQRRGRRGEERKNKSEKS